MPRSQRAHAARPYRLGMNIRRLARPSNRNLRPSASIGLLAAAVLGLTACTSPHGSSPEAAGATPSPAAASLVPVEPPSTRPEPSATPSPRWRPTPDAPVTRRIVEGTPPGALREETDEGARAAFDWFWRSVELAEANGDLTHLVEISHPDCEGCTEVIDRIAALHRAGGYTHSSYPQGHHPDVELDEETGEPVFHELVLQLRGRVYDAEDREVRTTPQRVHDSAVRTRWLGDRWVVMAYESTVVEEVGGSDED